MKVIYLKCYKNLTELCLFMNGPLPAHKTFGWFFGCIFGCLARNQSEKLQNQKNEKHLVAPWWWHVNSYSIFESMIQNQENISIIVSKVAEIFPDWIWPFVLLVCFDNFSYNRNDSHFGIFAVSQNAGEINNIIVTW